MPARVKHGRERWVLARMVLDLHRNFAAHYLGSAGYGSVADDSLLLCAIFVGHYEKRPMTAAKLAGFVGLPRTTVGRKLKRLVACGLVEMVDNVACLAVGPLNAEPVLKAFHTNKRVVLAAAAELSKMDT
jgi:hypothetical protein